MSDKCILLCGSAKDAARQLQTNDRLTTYELKLALINALQKIDQLEDKVFNLKRQVQT